jgi:hypothetical protein
MHSLQTLEAGSASLALSKCLHISIIITDYFAHTSLLRGYELQLNTIGYDYIVDQIIDRG